ncbi:hypothetical protein A2U01_0116739, partial [Trifolium medium]|nr:hypothetical protein [Trifolium medium]
MNPRAEPATLLRVSGRGALASPRQISPEM